MRALKFTGDPAALQLAARAVALRLRDLEPRPSRCALVPVPMHPRKRRRRGRDHAAWLAAEIGELTGARLLVGALRRVHDTVPQSDPRVTSRAANVAGAFAIARPRAVRGRRIVLVDDVSTSGATARECAAVLTAAGAARVTLLVAALG